MQGKHMLRQWMQAPTWDLSEIERRQEAVQYFTSNPDVRQQLKRLLQNVCLALRSLARVGVWRCVWRLLALPSTAA